MAPDAEVVILSVADGGEGTMAALAPHLHGVAEQCEAVDAWGERSRLRYLLGDGGRTAVVETAEAVGLSQVTPVSAFTPRRTSSFGLGLGILDAVRRGARRVLVPLGGSACTDGGAGVVLALGGRMWDAAGGQITFEAGTNPLLAGPCRVELPGDSGALAGVELVGFTDVQNPLTGVQGAAVVFAPQKGADDATVAELESALAVWGSALQGACGVPVAEVPGAGAAGGIGAAILALGGSLRSGFRAVADEIGIAESMRGADLVITGEGQFDAQSALGKVPYGMGSLGHDAGALVVALVGSVLAGPSDGPRSDMPLDAVIPIQSAPRTLEEAMEPAVATRELARAAAEVTRLVLAAREPRD